MRVYMVRRAETKQLVGIFVAKSREMLFDLIDECYDPCECEFTAMLCGGLYWPDRAPTVPIPLVEQAESLEHRIGLGEATITDSWSETIEPSGLSPSARWHRFPPGSFTKWLQNDPGR